MQVLIVTVMVQSQTHDDSLINSNTTHFSDDKLHSCTQKPVRKGVRNVVDEDAEKYVDRRLFDEEANVELNKLIDNALQRGLATSFYRLANHFINLLQFIQEDNCVRVAGGPVVDCRDSCATDLM